MFNHAIQTHHVNFSLILLIKLMEEQYISAVWKENIAS